MAVSEFHEFTQNKRHTFEGSGSINTGDRNEQKGDSILPCHRTLQVPFESKKYKELAKKKKKTGPAEGLTQR